jgi:hypothetical protein
MQIIEILLLLILFSVRGWMVHNYIRNKQGLSDVKFMTFYNELLNKLWLGELMIIIPFYSKVKNLEIKKKQKRINRITYFFYLFFGLLIFITIKFKY